MNTDPPAEAATAPIYAATVAELGDPQPVLDDLDVALDVDPPQITDRDQL